MINQCDEMKRYGFAVNPDNGRLLPRADIARSPSSYFKAFDCF